jgi:uncharacterized protein (TIGR01777 family)
MPSTFAITGATGLIGSALVARLRADGHVVRRITRTPRVPGDVPWHPDAGSLDPAALDGVDGVVHLAGASVADRWTEARRAEIRRSRAVGTRLIAESLGRVARPPRVLVSASAIGYYGDRGDERLDETSPPGAGFLADVCREWEAATAPAADAGVRVVHTRFGLVLAEHGGLLERLLVPFRLGVGGRLGDGRAWMSCIALDDLVAAVAFALATETLAGAANVVGPTPVTNAEFTDALGRVLHRPTLFAVPKTALRLLMGGRQADEMALASQRVVPDALLGAGFRFAHPTIDDALRSALR